MIRNSLVILIIAGAMIISSCTSQKKVEDLTKATREALEMVKQEAQRAIRLTAQKVQNNEVDPDIGKEVITNLQVAENKVDTQLVAANAINKAGNRDEILKFAEKSNLIIQSALTDLKSLNDLYDVGTFSQFETATFFPTGGYIIPTEKMDDARASLEPVVQRIIKFFGDHPNQRFVAVIVCYGFSDETPVARESSLYPSLLAKMNTSNPTRQQMNTKLSELRAKSIASLLVDVIKVNEGLIPNPRLINYDIKWLGKGEALPYPDKIKDYKSVDKRENGIPYLERVTRFIVYEGSGGECEELTSNN